MCTYQSKTRATLRLSDFNYIVSIGTWKWEKKILLQIWTLLSASVFQTEEHLDKLEVSPAEREICSINAKSNYWVVCGFVCFFSCFGGPSQNATCTGPILPTCYNQKLFAYRCQTSAWRRRALNYLAWQSVSDLIPALFRKMPLYHLVCIWSPLISETKQGWAWLVTWMRDPLGLGNTRDFQVMLQKALPETNPACLPEMTVVELFPRFLPMK